MSTVSLCIGSLLFLTIAGSCQAKDCNSDNIRNCWQQTSKDHCPLYRKISECLNSIEKNCADDAKTLELEFNIQGSAARAEQCPGLKLGECFASAIVGCHAEFDIPFNVRDRDETEANRKASCAGFKGKEQDAKTCLNNLATKCTSDHAQSEIKGSIRHVEDIQKICAKYE